MCNKRKTENEEFLDTRREKNVERKILSSHSISIKIKKKKWETADIEASCRATFAENFLSKEHEFPSLSLFCL